MFDNLIIFLLIIIGALSLIIFWLWLKNSQQEQEKNQEYTMYDVNKHIEKSLIEKTKELDNNLKMLAKEKLAIAIEKYASSVIQHNFTYTFELENDQKRGKLIGRNGRNIKTLETLLGVNVILDSKSNVVQISCFNPLRREIAKNTLLALLESKKINQSNIEKEIIAQKEKLDEIIMKKGQEATTKLEIFDFPKELISNIGQLYFRTSFGQNTLLHSLEVGQIAGNLAKEIGENEILARKAGLLHDVGKAIDFDKKGDHISLGIKIAKKYINNEIIIDAIASHHEQRPKFLISWLVKAADQISAARIGARKNTISDYVAKISKLEKVVTSFPKVQDAYAINGGREIRVLVNANIVSDQDSEVLAFKIKDFIEKNLTFPGALDIVVIREKKFKTKAFQKKDN